MVLSPFRFCSALLCYRNDIAPLSLRSLFAVASLSACYCPDIALISPCYRPITLLSPYYRLSIALLSTSNRSVIALLALQSPCYRPDIAPLWLCYRTDIVSISLCYRCALCFGWHDRKVNENCRRIEYTSIIYLNSVSGQST